MYEEYIFVLKDLVDKLYESDEYYHLGGDVENIITELEGIK